MRRIELGGVIYTWAELSQPKVRETVRPHIEKLMAEYKENPARLQKLGFTDADAKAAENYIGGAYDGWSEEKLETSFAEENMAEKTTIQELSELYASPEYKKASQLAATNKAMLDDPSRAQEKHAWMRAAKLERSLKAAEPK